MNRLWEIDWIRVPIRFLIGAVGIVVIPAAAFAAAFTLLWLLIFLNGLAIGVAPG